MKELKERIDEIPQLVAEGNLERAIKRLLDFIQDFIEEDSLLFEVFVISSNYAELVKEEKQESLESSVFEERKRQTIIELQDLHREVCNLLNHQNATSQKSSTTHTTIKEIICSTQTLRKTFQKSDFTLGEINIDIEQNEVLAVVGENANGKTTLFEILAGKLKHDSGEILFPVFDKNTSKKLNWIQIKSHIAYVEQELPRWYGTLKNNLHYEATCHGIKGEENEKDVNFIVHRLGLVEHIHKKWNQLSGGYKLRFSLAKAFIKKPQLIILDEPLANLDIKTQMLVLNDLRDLANSVKYPVSIVISSQHLEEIEHIADKILFLNQGKPVFYGNKNELGKDRQHNFFEIETTLSKEQVMQKLQNIEIIDITTNAMYMQVITPLEVTSEKILTELLRQEIPIIYFKDISQSIKKLFV